MIGDFDGFQSASNNNRKSFVNDEYRMVSGTCDSLFFRYELIIIIIGIILPYLSSSETPGPWHSVSGDLLIAQV